jgi:hypothetical protein
MFSVQVREVASKFLPHKHIFRGDFTVSILLTRAGFTSVMRQK